MKQPKQKFGGQYVPELLMSVLEELQKEFEKAKNSEDFQRELEKHLNEFAGRPTGLYHAENLSKEYGCKVFLKRGDLLHGGAHKINNTVGQALLAKKMGKNRLIAETGAGQHGVATAMAGAYFDLDVEIFMGREDIKRQKMNALRMKKLGAEINPVDEGSATLKEATTAALKNYISTSDNTHYLIGSVVGPEPYPEMVKYFQSVIGEEAHKQFKESEGELPDAVFACIGGGSNAAGIFSGFVDNEEVDLYGAEAAGEEESEESAAALTEGKPGIFHGFKSYLLQDEQGNISPTDSISAGLDYPGVGPMHSRLKELDRAVYHPITDEEALEAFTDLSKHEGIIPALEPSHALALAEKHADKYDKVIVNMCGRGDKDMDNIAEVEDLEFN
jgi:tryptophan synthase beta chain